MTPLRLFATASVLIALTGCTRLGPGNASSGPGPLPPIVLDGEFRAVPVTGATPKVPASRALEVFAQQDQDVFAYDKPVLARVTWSAPTLPTDPDGKLPKQGTLAWVLVFQPAPPATSCPVGQRSPGVPNPATGHSQRSAVVVDASTGTAALYVGSQPVCNSWTPAHIAAAYRYVSLAWERAAKDSVRILLPPCASLVGSKLHDDIMTLTALEPLEGPCSGPAATVVTSDIVSNDWKRLSHAPVGEVCSRPVARAGYSTPVLPDAPGCVRSY